MVTEQMTQEQFIHLYQKWRSQQLTEMEWHQFQQTVVDPEMKSMLFIAVQQDLQVPEFDNLLTAEERQEAYRKLIEQMDASRTNVKAPTHRIRFLKTAWFKYAAAVLIIFGSVAYFWINTRNGKDVATTNVHRLQTDVLPGGEKAVLTLADGSKIILDNAANGNLARQGNVQVVKLANGQIAYNVKGLSDKDMMWNTMRTPTGGQYQVTLPDGTKVWLNAASSITYPVAFVSKNRKVKITGEVYFEVAKNEERPFMVDIDGKLTVQVLGTSFNINSYQNEASIKTTLITGSVKVSNDSDRSVILHPGYQAVVASPDQQLQVIAADLDQTVAWKNGLFNFNGSDLRGVMRQLERWYDVKVQYEGTVDNGTFRGRIYRSVNLSDVLDILKEAGGVKFRMEGKTLIVF